MKQNDFMFKHWMEAILLSSHIVITEEKCQNTLRWSKSSIVLLIPSKLSRAEYFIHPVFILYFLHQ